MITVEADLHAVVCGSKDPAPGSTNYTESHVHLEVQILLTHYTGFSFAITVAQNEKKSKLDKP